jgi:hypothetical protein
VRSLRMARRAWLRSARARAAQCHRGWREPPRWSARRGRARPSHPRWSARTGRRRRSHGHRPVSMQLHLGHKLLGLAGGDVEPGLAHRLHNHRPHCRRGLRARRLRAHVRRSEVFEERLGHLRASGVVSAYQQHVLHVDCSAGYCEATEPVTSHR